MLCRWMCCMSASQCMFGSLWSVVIAHEHRRQDVRWRNARQRPTNERGGRPHADLAGLNNLTELLWGVYCSLRSCRENKPPCSNYRVALAYIQTAWFRRLLTFLERLCCVFFWFHYLYFWRFDVLFQWRFWKPFIIELSFSFHHSRLCLAVLGLMFRLFHVHIYRVCYLTETCLLYYAALPTGLIKCCIPSVSPSTPVLPIFLKRENLEHSAGQE